MQSESAQKHKLRNFKLMPLIALILTAGMAVGGYKIFTNYSPKALVEVREVKGIKSEKPNLIDISYPEGSYKISDTKTSDTITITLLAKQPPEEVVSFYEKTLFDKGWEHKSKDFDGEFFKTEYKRNNNELVITSASQNSNQTEGNTTIVTIELFY